MWPVWCAIAAYIFACGAQLALVLHKTHGHQLYPLDDTYIHAAVGKNIALHGVYGLTRYHSSFPCSSILWPFILALSFLITGVRVWVPFALNAVFSVAVLFIAWRLLQRMASHLSPVLHALSLVLLVFGVPLVGMTFLGMEHILQLLAFLLLLGSYEAATRSIPAAGAELLLLISAFLSASARYEGLFAVLMVCGLLAFGNRWKLAISAAAAAALPVLAFGLYGLSQGSTFLPSPLLVKTAGARKYSPLTCIENLFGRHALLSGVTLTFLLCSVLLIYLYRRFPGRYTSVRHWLIIVLGTLLLHAQFAQFGGFFRYEAYLIGAGIVVLFAGLSVLQSEGGSLPGAHQAQTLARALLALAILGFSARAAIVLYIVPEQAYGVYEQQYQVARFLGRYYTGQTVALNDIGAPNYFDDIDCLDLWGLGSVEVQRLRSRGAFDRSAIDRLTSSKGVKIAVVYRSWFDGRIPARWVPVFDWRVTDITGHSVLGGYTVTFYAVDPTQASLLAHNILDFARELPSGVQATPLSHSIAGAAQGN